MKKTRWSAKIRVGRVFVCALLEDSNQYQKLEIKKIKKIN